MRIRSFSSVLLFFLLLAGCDSADDGGSGESSLPGTYDMTSLQDLSGDLADVPNITFVAGTPTVVTVGGLQSTWTVSGALTLTGSTYSTSLTVNISVAGQQVPQSFTENGTYSLDGSIITFIHNGEATTATYTQSGDTLTLSDAESVIVYQKR